MSYTEQDIHTALTRELTDERVATAAAYWMDASPHERWVPDGIILARYARHAMAEIERLKYGGWISVKERLPEVANGQWAVFVVPCLFGTNLSFRLTSRYFAELGWTNKEVLRATHWMPLLEPPEKGE